MRGVVLLVSGLVLTGVVACIGPARAGGAGAGAVTRIMPLGDSITRGKDDDGYRSHLAKLLLRQGISFRFVGSLKDGPWWSGERDHEGHNGAQIHDLIGGIAGWLAQAKPDVILLMIGANDVEANNDLPGMPQRYQTLLDRIFAAAPRARVLVSEISLIRIPEFDQRARAFNPKIKEIARATAARGHAVTFVPMHDVLSPLELDAVDHPDFRGNQEIAARWMTHLGPLLGR